VNQGSQNITFDGTGAWTTWTTRDVPVSLGAGTVNVIRLESDGQDLANIDQIEVVAGGPPPSGPATYEAETAVTAGGAAPESLNGGFTGSGYVNFPALGGTLEFRSVDGGTGGSRTLRIRFALGASASRTGALVVNGAARNVTFDSTLSWTSWATQDLTVNLSAGTANTIQFQSNGQDLANIDQIEVR
jgi:rhamnogalacturonan endolyase